MKTSAKNIEKGMTIKVSSIKYYEQLNKTSVECGSIKKSSPVLEIIEVKEDRQKFKNLKNLTLITQLGEIEISTRSKIEIV